MATTFKNMMREVMNMAHRAFQLKGAYMSWTECLKQAWQVIKLKARMKKQVVEFYFQKMNGEIRQAWAVSKSLRIGFEIVLKSTDSLKIKTFLHLIILSNEKKAVVFAKSMPFHWIWRRSCA